MFLVFQNIESTKITCEIRNAKYNIDDIIEIKRGLHKICVQKIVNIIADLDRCEEFYRDLLN